MPSPRRVSVDISLYPLTETFKEPILAFIRELRAVPGLEVVTNPLSTQVHGPFALVWATLGETLERSFGSDYLQVAVLKLVSVDVTE